MRRLETILIRSGPAYRLARRTLVFARYFARRPHEPDFAAVRLLPLRPGIFLDVGANAGQSALSFRIYDRRTPILSIEPNPYHEPSLRFCKTLLRPFDYLICAAGAENGTRTLYIPMFRGVPLTGEASLVREEAEQSHWIRSYADAGSPDVGLSERTVEVRRLDDLELAPKLVKIDVEGAELAVLHGLERTLATHGPVLLVERGGERFEGVRRFLAGLGYAPFVFDAGRRRIDPYAGQVAQNVFFLPSDKAASTG